MYVVCLLACFFEWLLFAKCRTHIISLNMIYRWDLHLYTVTQMVSVGETGSTNYVLDPNVIYGLPHSEL